VTPSFLDLPVGAFLDQVAARTPAPGGGGAAAVTAALAAGLAAMAARFSAAQLPEAGDLAMRADELRAQVAGLADADADAYRGVLDAYALPRDDAGRRQRVRDALRGAAAVPLEVAEVAAQVAGIAAGLAASGNPNLRGDAVTAAQLAAAAARSAACLVQINVGGGDARDAELTGRATQAVAEASAAAERAAAAT
jgi:methenyltetrahydrofolate cyclohydrolase